MGKYKNLEEWREELVGKQFGRLTVQGVENYLNKDGKKKGYQARCKCSCGGTKIVQISSLLKGLTTSCGCYRREVEKDLGMRLGEWRKEHIDEVKNIREKNITSLLEWRENHKEEFLVSVQGIRNRGTQKEGVLENHKKRFIGERFGKLTVMDIKHRVNSNGCGDGYDALCLCECGKEKLVSIAHLLSGDIKSCGCSKREYIIPSLKLYMLDCFSIEEKEIYNYLLSLGYSVERQFLLEGHYFDFRVNNFLIEYHGSIYHYTKYENLNNPESKDPVWYKKDSNYHKNLRDIAINNDYYLIQVWDYDWIYNKEFVQKLIKDHLSGVVDYRDYVIEDCGKNLLSNDYGFIIEGEYVEPKGVWISTGYRKIVDENYSKGKVLIYNSGYTEIK